MDRRKTCRKGHLPDLYVLIYSAAAIRPHSEPVQKFEQFTTSKRTATPSSEARQRIVVNESPATQTIIYHEESAHYEKQFAAQPTVRATGDASSAPVQRPIPTAAQENSSKLHRRTMSGPSQPAPAHASISRPTTRPTLPHTQSWSPHQPGNHDQSWSHVQSGGHVQMGSHSQEDYENHRQVGNHAQLRPKQKHNSWGGELLKGMAKSIVSSAAKEVVKDTTGMVDSSIGSAFTSFGSQQ